MPFFGGSMTPTDFKPYRGRMRRPGTGCVSELSGHLSEGRYSPVWPDGKKHARNVCAHTREECEEKLQELIVQMKKEIAKKSKDCSDTQAAVFRQSF